MILLASQSPRRRELLAQIGCSFEVLVSDAEEVMTDALAPEDVVRENARCKALAVAKLRPDVPVLGADTVVARAGHIYGKPKDAADARHMLASLAGGAHEVLTGIALVHGGTVWDDVARTRVFFAPMTQEEIVRYVATGEPMDKAGAYAVQGRAAAFIERIEGSYSNVVGLPLHAVCTLAQRARVNLGI